MKIVKDLRGHLHLRDKASKKKVVATLLLSMTMVMMFGVQAFAASTTTDFSSITNAITGKLTVAEVAAIIAAIIGAGMGFVLLWFGARKLVGSIIKAFKTGKIKF